MLCIFMQFRKKLVFSIVSSICKFGITYILPNNSWLLWRFRSEKLAVYAAHAQCMQYHAAVAIRCPAARAIIPGARWCVVCVSLSVSGCAPLPPSPPGCRKNGAALRRQPMRYDTQPFETSRQTSSRSTQVQRATSSTSFQSCVSIKVFHTLSGVVRLVFSTFDAIL